MAFLKHLGYPNLLFRAFFLSSLLDYSWIFGSFWGWILKINWILNFFKILLKILKALINTLDKIFGAIDNFV